jgi:hypothetical protein
MMMAHTPIVRQFEFPKGRPFFVSTGVTITGTWPSLLRESASLDAIVFPPRNHG